MNNLGVEQIGESETTPARSFSDILFGRTSGKRCVYRGRGAPCNPTGDEDGGNNYATTTQKGHYTCAPNYYCQELSSDDSTETLHPKFNNRISRFAKNIAFQNDSDDVPEDDLDSVGWGARLLGRPLEYDPSEVQNDMPNKDGIQNLLDNKVTAICMPGRGRAEDIAAPTQKDTLDIENSNGGDRINGQGVTSSLGTGDVHYTFTCPVFNDEGNYIHRSVERNVNVIDNLLPLFRKQTTSTNMLKIFEGDNFGNDVEEGSLVTDYTENHITQVIMEENRCLRAPGAVCHTNLDCAQNQLVTQTLQNIFVDGNDILNGVNGLNKYEVLYWQTEMICSQPLFLKLTQSMTSEIIDVAEIMV